MELVVGEEIAVGHLRGGDQVDEGIDTRLQSFVGLGRQNTAKPHPATCRRPNPRRRSPPGSLYPGRQPGGSC